MTNAKFAMLIGAVIFSAFITSVMAVGIKERDQNQLRFEQCISAGMQWNRGDCLK